MTEILSFNNVSKVFKQGDNQITALNQANFSINEGEFAAVVGPSGSGKSTFLAIAGGLLKPSTGDVHLNRESIVNIPDKSMTSMRLHHIGFVFQDANLIPYLTVLEQLLFISHLVGDARDEAHDKAKALLDDLGMAHRSNHYPNKLSRGERQRVVIARAMINEPELILADEPTASLDSKRGRSVVEMISDEVKSRNIATIMVTHDERMLDFCDQIYNMEDGELQKENE